MQRKGGNLVLLCFLLRDSWIDSVTVIWCIALVQIWFLFKIVSDRWFKVMDWSTFWHKTCSRTEIHEDRADLMHKLERKLTMLYWTLDIPKLIFTQTCHTRKFLQLKFLEHNKLGFYGACQLSLGHYTVLLHLMSFSHSMQWTRNNEGTMKKQWQWKNNEGTMKTIFQMYSNTHTHIYM